MIAVAKQDGVSFNEALRRRASGTFYMAVAIGTELLQVGVSDLVDLLWTQLATLGLPHDAWVALLLIVIRVAARVVTVVPRQRGAFESRRRDGAAARAAL